MSGLDLARLFSRAFYQDAVLPSVTKCPSVACSSGKSLGNEIDNQIGEQIGVQTGRSIDKEPHWN